MAVARVSAMVGSGMLCLLTSRVAMFSDMHPDAIRVGEMTRKPVAGEPAKRKEASGCAGSDRVTTRRGRGNLSLVFLEVSDPFGLPQH